MGRLSRTGISLLFVLAACSLIWAQADITIPIKGKASIIAYGDVRFTDPANKDVSNAMFRDALVQRIAAEEPGIVVMTGDLVLNGSNAADWKVFESETKPWHDANLRVLPIIGNHDLNGNNQVALTNWFSHFPELRERRWYSVRYGNALLLMLDSDADDRGAPEWQWLETQLNDVPSDIDFVFVVTHHPEYTRSGFSLNSGHAARNQEKQVAALFEQHQKTMRARIIALSGHVHNYERYEHGGVMYVVTGGGGATPYSIKRDPSDFYTDPGPTYHYCHITLDGPKLMFEMVKAEPSNGGVQWQVRDRFELQAAAAKSAMAK
jgi:hypothetical protein